MPESDPPQDPLPEDSDSDEDSLHSDQIDVLLNQDVVGYQAAVTIGKLNRNTFRRLLWRNKFISFMVKMMILHTFDTMSLFMLNVERYGMNFVHAMIVLMFLVGYPLVYMETALGQYTSTNAYFVFRRLAPAFGGIGILAIINNVFSLIHVILLTPLYVFGTYHVVMPTSQEFPWHSCLALYNRQVCRVMYLECDRELSSQKIINHVLTEGIYLRGSFCYNSMIMKGATENLQTGSIDQEPFESWMSTSSLFQQLMPYMKIDGLDDDTLPAHLIIKFVCVWLFVWIILYRGERAIKLLSFLTFATSMAFGILLTIMLGGFFNQSSFLYYHALFQSSKSIFENLDVWNSAMIFVVRALRIGEGVHIYFGSQNDFTNGISQDAFIAIAIVFVGPCVGALLCGFISDSLVLQLVDGNLQRFLNAKKKMMESPWFHTTDSVVRTIMTMEAFNVFGYNEAGLMLILILSGSLIVLSNATLRVEIIWRTVCDIAFTVTDKLSPKILLHIVLCLVGMASLLFANEEMFDAAVQIEDIVAPHLTFAILLLEIFVITAVYGPKRFFTNTVCMRKMRDENFPLIHLTRSVFMLFAWCILVPLMFIVILVSPFTIQITLFSKIIISILFSIAPIYFFRKMILCYMETRTFSLALEPEPDLWGPRRATDRATAEFVDRKFSKNT